MKYALLCFRQRFFKKSTVAVILLGIFLIGTAWFARSYLSIQDYVASSDPNDPYWVEYQDSSVLSDEAFRRYFDASVRVSESNAFSFYAVVNNSFLLYILIGNLLVGIAGISFFRERKNHFTKLKFMRIGDYRRSVMGEAIAVSLTGWLYALIPCLFVWLIASIFCPYILPQGQSIDVMPYAMMKSICQENAIVFAYLIEILMYSLQFIFTGLLAFSFGLIVNNGIILLFIPIFYVMVVNFIGNASGYTVSFYIMGAPHSMSYAPLFFSCFYTFVIALIVFIFFTKKEKTMNV